MQWVWLGYMGWIFGQLEPDLQASLKYSTHDKPTCGIDQIGLDLRG